VAADSVGNFVVAWTSTGGYGGVPADVFGQRYASDGTPLGLEFQINTYTTSAQNTPRIAAGSAGNFVVVWSSEGQDGSTLGVFGQRFASSGAPLGSEFRVNTYTTANQYIPSVASDSAGNFVVAWTNSGGVGPPADVSGQRYASDGTPLGPEFRINTYTTNVQNRPSVAADPAGNFVVVWHSQGQDGSNFGVFGQRFASSGVPLGPEFRVNTYTTGYQDFPSVATDAAGNFVVAWTSSGGYGGVPSDLFGQRYASDGTPLGAEFLVNTFTTNAQNRPAVAAHAAGNFVVVWDSYGQDGSFTGVFGQRYSPIVPVELMHFGVE
jgi:phage tail sheath gpL-like